MRTVYRAFLAALIILSVVLLAACNNETAEDTQSSETVSETAALSIETNISDKTEAEPTEEEDDSEDAPDEDESWIAVPGEGELDEYGPQYEKTWTSDDGRITFIMDNKFGFDGFTGYDGTYRVKSGKIHAIDASVKRGGYAYIERMDIIKSPCAI